MATQNDVRRIALSLPAATEDGGSFMFRIAGKPLAWAWQERVDPRRPRVPSREVIAVRVRGELDKQTLLELDPEVFFTEPHYEGYPAVLVRLARADETLLRKLLSDAWQVQAPARLRRTLRVG